MCEMLTIGSTICYRKHPTKSMVLVDSCCWTNGREQLSWWLFRVMGDPKWWSKRSFGL